MRGYESSLVIKNVGFEHSGEFVCKARNFVKKVKKEIQSDLVHVSVKGAPQIQEHKSVNEIIVRSGDNVDIKIPFCSNPSPSIDWIMFLPGSSENMISLTSGTRNGRFMAEIQIDESEQHCYQAVLTIMGSHPAN